MKKKYYWIIGVIVIIVLGVITLLNYVHFSGTKGVRETNVETNLLNLSFFEESLKGMFINCTHNRGNEFTNSSNLFYYCQDNEYRLQFMPHPPGYKDGCCLKMGNSDFEKFDEYKGYSLCIKAKNILIEVNDYKYDFYLFLSKNVSEETLKDVAVSIANKLNVNDTGFNVFPSCQPASTPS
jgi:hypothetical protein